MRHNIFHCPPGCQFQRILSCVLLPVRVAKSLANKALDHKVWDSWWQTCHAGDQCLPSPAVSPEVVTTALKQMKTGTAAEHDNIHLEFLSHLALSFHAWLAVFFTRVTYEQRIFRIWRRAKIIALETPGNGLHLATSHQPMSFLSICYKTLECIIILQCMSAPVENLLRVDQADFQRIKVPPTHSCSLVTSSGQHSTSSPMSQSSH